MRILANFPWDELESRGVSLRTFSTQNIGDEAPAVWPVFRTSRAPTPRGKCAQARASQSESKFDAPKCVCEKSLRVTSACFFRAFSLRNTENALAPCIPTSHMDPVMRAPPGSVHLALRSVRLRLFSLGSCQVHFLFFPHLLLCRFFPLPFASASTSPLARFFRSCLCARSSSRLS